MMVCQTPAACVFRPLSRAPRVGEQFGVPPKLAADQILERSRDVAAEVLGPNGVALDEPLHFQNILPGDGFGVYDNHT